MADGARAISNSVSVLGPSCVRLMCWSHVHTAYSNKLKKLKNVQRRKGVDEDLKKLQWAVQNPAEFKTVLDLLAQKHMRESQENEEESASDTAALKDFFLYFFEQWGPDSHACNWYEAAHPFAVGNNQGVESKNNTIKEIYSFRERLPMGEFVDMVELIATESSRQDDNLLFSSR